MELEEQQKNIDQQHLIDAVARYMSAQTGEPHAHHREALRQQTSDGFLSAGSATPDTGEDEHGETRQELDDELARRREDAAARRTHVAMQAIEGLPRFCDI